MMLPETMNLYWEEVLVLLGFIIVSVASARIGSRLTSFRLPLISGFLISGLIIGPHVLNFVSASDIHRLRFVEQFSLAYIACAAGAELYLKELRTRLSSIRYATIGLVFSTFVFGSLTIFFLSEKLPFMHSLSVQGRVVVSILAASIMVARSPSSAIAIVKELRARGPFTQTALGVTVITDVIVIILFAVNSEITDAVVSRIPLDYEFVLLLVDELVLSTVSGIILALIIEALLTLRASKGIKIGFILTTGFSVFIFSSFIREYSAATLSMEIMLEPLLICMVAGFLVANKGRNRDQFLYLLQEAGPYVYVVFFTFTGASFALDLLKQVWVIAVVLFVVRTISIFIGAFVGGTLAGDPPSFNKYGWMAYITQAGVGLGLAREIAVEFPEWGETFATTMIAVIIINQMVGPPMFRQALVRIGEAHKKAATPEFDGVRDAYLFGLRAETVALARRLARHGWVTKIINNEKNEDDEPLPEGVITDTLDEITLEGLKKIGIKKADAVVSFLPDEESYELCRLIYENYGLNNIIVRLQDRNNYSRFSELGVTMVEPKTAFVALVENLVRSPGASALLLGTGKGQAMEDIEVHNAALHGLPIRDLRLPLDVMIISISRDRCSIVPKNYTRLQLGDRITMVGPEEKLEEITLRFDG